MQIIFNIAAFLTAFYITRLCFIIKTESKFSGVNYAEILPSCALLGLNILFYIKIRNFEYEISLPYISAILALLIVAVLYKKVISKIKIKTEFINIVQNKLIPSIYTNIANLCYSIDIKIFSQYKPVIMTAKYGVKFVNWIENNVMNKTINKTTEIIKGISKWDSILQNKNIQTYNTYALIIATIVISFVLAAYKLIIEELN